MLPSPALKPISSPSSNGAIASGHGRQARVHPGVAATLVLLRAYKVLVSPLFTGSCRFEPSCSDYMADAVRTHGVVRGVWLGTRRLARCHPFGGHGFDPVP